MKKLLTLTTVVLSLFVLTACSKTVEPKETTLNAPQNLTLADKTVSFDAVTGTDVTYNLFIDDVTTEKVSFEEIKDLTETTYTITGLETNKLYEVRVQAQSGDLVSVKTNAVSLHTFLALDTVYATYNTLESIPVTILGLDNVEIYYMTYGKVLNSHLSASSYTYEQNVLSLDYSNLNTDSTLTFYVFTASGYYTVEVDKVTSISPSIYSEGSVTFDNQDLYFQFDFAGGEFVELSGSDIGVDDYTLVNNTLIINKEFISNLFTLNETRTTVILSYQLKTDDDIVIGYLFIEKDAN